jgi:transposase InsO family protein
VSIVLRIRHIQVKRKVFGHIVPKGHIPFVTLHIDHSGPLKKTPNGKKYVFEIIDNFTKFVKFYAVSSTRTKESINKLEDYFSHYSVPVRIVSDRGSCFTSYEFDDFIKKHNITHVKIATASPKSNGQIERVNRDLTSMLAKLSKLKNKWHTALTKVEFAMNNSFSRSTKSSASKLLFGVDQRDHNDSLRNYLLETDNINEERDLELLRSDAEQQNIKVQNYNKTNYDRKHKAPTCYELGDRGGPKKVRYSVGNE